ncbi:hypothetical protein PISMIDRAFT_329154 [Pisolithus microcarpus 441]|uniref:Uncharacterized protein n=1 Tax=Pisolithus microcarpus 441 TaxID=765257 RepID=A0A0C9YF96_9AGAM|nr:hypothetical protein BKA83DRAFT_329154 [Pisolithus microcarpus]KIK15286.1 hypothetical protein PISMIDRAFT_329154 [Pisolithus microcarpus 441]
MLDSVAGPVLTPGARRGNECRTISEKSTSDYCKFTRLARTTLDRSYLMETCIASMKWNGRPGSRLKPIPPTVLCMPNDTLFHSDRHCTVLVSPSEQALKSNPRSCGDMYTQVHIESQGAWTINDVD